MTREEREMDIWQRAYENPMLMDPKTKAASADAALKAFREAFPNDPITIALPAFPTKTCTCAAFNAAGEAIGSPYRSACAACTPTKPDSGTWSRPGEP